MKRVNARSHEVATSLGVIRPMTFATDQRWIRPTDPITDAFGLTFLQDRKRYFASDFFFPFVGGAEDGGYTGTYSVFEALNTLRRESSRWGDEVGAPRVSLRGKGVAFLAEDWGFESVLTDKTRKNWQMSGKDPEAKWTQMLTEKLWLDREYRSAQILLNSTATSTSLAGTLRWDSTAAVPRTDVRTGCRTVMFRTGQWANRVGVSGLVYDDIFQRESTGSAGLSIKNSIQYVLATTGKNLTPDLMAGYFGVDELRPLMAMQSDATKTETTTIGDALPENGNYVFSGKEVYIFYGQDDAGPDSLQYGASLGPLYFGSDRYREEKTRGDVMRVFNALIEKEVCIPALYIIKTAIS